MLSFTFPSPSLVDASRRAFVGRSTRLLSATGIALLTGCESLAAQKSSGSAATAGDVDILNSALAAEHKGIAAYDVGAHSGLLQKPALDLAIQFQGHHKAHADLLAATIRKLGARR